jgi:argininosuccinate lyase
MLNEVKEGTIIMKQLWGSRFSKKVDKSVNDFNSSLRFDRILYKYDIQGSIAHVSMLRDQSILSEDETTKIIVGLNEILQEIEDEKVEFDEELEDIHTNIEKLLIEKIGEIGKKVHTARSRNDQVALDLRMYMREETVIIEDLLIKLIKELISISKSHTETIMPGYTHLQRAQPITFAHHLGAYVEMFKRDFTRLEDGYQRINILPLGAGALATSPHNIDRYKTLRYLQFKDICLNSLDAVSDRDFVIETLSSLSLIMMHLSRFCEEIILWSSFEFKFIELDDGFSTGSSLMPQKKNPDVAELIRGKTGRVYGSLMSLLTTMKSLPLAYNKDMQEDKEPLFDAINTVKQCLEILPPMLSTMSVNKAKMLCAVKEGFINATDVADYLVKKGIPFRDAHENAGKLVAFCIQIGKTLDELKLEDYKNVNPSFDKDIFKAISVQASLNSRKVIGGPASEAIKKVIAINEDWIKDHE